MGLLPTASTLGPPTGAWRPAWRPGQHWEAPVYWQWGGGPWGTPPWPCPAVILRESNAVRGCPRVFLSPSNRHFGMVMPLACAWVPLSWCEEVLWGERDPHCHPHCHGVKRSCQNESGCHGQKDLEKCWDQVCASSVYKADYRIRCIFGVGPLTLADLLQMTSGKRQQVAQGPSLSTY